MKCGICDKSLEFVWTDTHGVGRCWTCGAPYLIYHYEGEPPNRQRLDKPPELLIKPDWVALTRLYWQDMRSSVAPTAYEFVNLSSRAIEAQTQLDNWLEAHRGEWPQVDEAAQTEGAANA